MTSSCNRCERRGEVPMLYTTGSFYEVGFDIGKTFKDRIQGYWAASHNIQNVMLPFVATAEGTELYKSFLKVCQDAFPQYIREVQGMAVGCELPFKNIFMLTFEKEVVNSLAPTEKDTSIGCTDILINRPGCKILAHNEDAYHLVDYFGYMISVRIIEDEEEVESFTAYCYPGTIPGGNSSFNRHGMVFSTDALYARDVIRTAPPRDYVSRCVIKAKTIDEATRLLKNTGYGVAHSFALNIVDIKNPSMMWCVEVAPQAGESNVHVHAVGEQSDPDKPCHFAHANKFLHITDVPELSRINSSMARISRINQLEPPRTKTDALQILGDEFDTKFPIYRNPHAEGPARTIYTAVVDVLENKFEVYRDKPSITGQRPLFHLPIKDGTN